MTKLKFTQTNELDVSPELLARLFWEMDNEQQGGFFDALRKLAGDNLAPQMENVACFTDSLSLNALEAMAEIGKEASMRLKDTL